VRTKGAYPLERSPREDNPNPPERTTSLDPLAQVRTHWNAPKPERTTSLDPLARNLHLYMWGSQEFDENNLISLDFFVCESFNTL